LRWSKNLAAVRLSADNDLSKQAPMILDRADYVRLLLTGFVVSVGLGHIGEIVRIAAGPELAHLVHGSDGAVDRFEGLAQVVGEWVGVVGIGAWPGCEWSLSSGWSSRTRG
jgi:hypothetical protein